MVHKNADKIYPSANSPRHLANKFADCFIDKVKGIQTKFHDITSAPVFQSAIINSDLNSFCEISFQDISKLLLPFTTKSSDLDPLLGKILSNCIHLLFPTITKIVNLPLLSGITPSKLKQALIKPLLKK